MNIVNVYNLGLAGFIQLKGFDSLSASKEDGVSFEMTKEHYKELKNEYFNSEFKKYNDILRSFAVKFKPKQ